ncbi:DUF4959 domain-containing protein [Maribellus sp. YY47]|uniref:DUF4959 domain-containing protein n=1 Tax=Maribellus sp. YY47 TaxID=2929486 RepID=UPI0020010CC8|nr:DUF4959 domain-containing protein [Maribellus sp. YY47]MCK3684063.1 DUF4959 domain-containing protein [Maribellus sp. YY47]
MKITINLLVVAAFILLMFSCEEETVHLATSNDKTPPKQPTNITYTPLYGGARFHYTVPDDEDLLSVEARYTNKQGQSFSFSASYFVDSLDIYGFGDTINYEVELYGVDRAGNKSTPVMVSVKPLESAIARVIKSLDLKPAFGAFFIDWENELEQSINIYVDFSYTQNGDVKQFTSVFSSNLETDRRFIEDLALGQDQPVDVQIRVSDIYGNTSDPVDMGQITLLEDGAIDKTDWFLPLANDSVGGVPQAFGDNVEGRLVSVIDGIIDEGSNLNFMHTGGRGRTGLSKDGNMPWNVIIDLGDYYELSRIVTHQRHMDFCGDLCQGQYFRGENVGIYEMYIFDEATQEWEYVSQNKIAQPVGLSELEIVKKGKEGDMAYMFPDDPQYTKPTRWFRYRAMKGFGGNYTLDNANCLSEITLYGRKAGN